MLVVAAVAGEEEAAWATPGKIGFCVLYSLLDVNSLCFSDIGKEGVVVAAVAVVVPSAPPAIDRARTRGPPRGPIGALRLNHVKIDRG